MTFVPQATRGTSPVFDKNHFFCWDYNRVLYPGFLWDLAENTGFGLVCLFMIWWLSFSLFSGPFEIPFYILLFCSGKVKIVRIFALWRGSFFFPAVWVFIFFCGKPSQIFFFRVCTTHYMPFMWEVLYKHLHIDIIV